ncbi:MAG: HAD family hydrolase [Saccharolobus sp.]|uniref:Hydrolase related to 2-haloalkanoic acid dehalogenase n=1 Tax=Saccharolobus shibatae (strain ATCC 51178 / DSM 5389 / JCM 8931 / NBRC 15437 / B12) TaxID=523848 RepID=A0A8F5BR41_SACSH|nr:HAD family hydrolase [Saccharolobus shibatae]MCH4814934.1 HAD family hydrolase [Saccharolobus shibatae]QXJ29799.1 Hydrolase related to 2-haloalkanoic acid dehalogenase [Saccharolobus shibatae B12]
MSINYKIFNNVKAVLFDFDDTLVDFSTKANDALDAVSKDIYTYIKENYRQEIDINIIKKLVEEESKKLDSQGEYNRNKWWESILKSLNIVHIDKSQLYDWTSLYWSIASQTEPYEDAKEIVEYLDSKGYKLGIVTNSDGEGGNKSSRLKTFPLIDKFDLILIAGEGGIRPKPNLEPFIISCEKLSVDPRSCVFVGDEPVKDCLAAKKANMISVLIDREGKVKNAELYADFVISSLKQLEEFL